MSRSEVTCGRWSVVEGWEVWNWLYVLHPHGVTVTNPDMCQKLQWTSSYSNRIPLTAGHFFRGFGSMRNTWNSVYFLKYAAAAAAAEKPCHLHGCLRVEWCSYGFGQFKHLKPHYYHAMTIHYYHRNKHSLLCSWKCVNVLLFPTTMACEVLAQDGTGVPAEMVGCFLKNFGVSGARLV